jgi:hypothetical protein
MKKLFKWLVNNKYYCFVYTKPIHIRPIYGGFTFKFIWRSKVERWYFESLNEYCKQKRKDLENLNETL